MFKYKLLAFAFRNKNKKTIQGRKDLISSHFESGFSLIEVLVTILVITGFLLGSLQATVLAALLRIQAQDKQEATNFIQQDLELIRLEAFTFTDTTLCATSTYGTGLQTDLTNSGFTTTATTTINNKNYEVSRTYTPSGNTLEITYQLDYASTHPRFISGGDNTVATLATEVFADEVLSCP